jgi:hypothetical protein
MARKEGTGGRGSLGTLPEGFSPDDFDVVSEAEELTRSTAAPSEFQPLVDMAREHLGRKFERTVKVQATNDNGEPVWETDGDGNVVTDDDGNAIPVMTRVPHLYKLEEAKKFQTELRNVGNRNKLPAKRLSLRIVTDPPLAKATETDEIRVQFYIVSRSPQEPQA